MSELDPATDSLDRSPASEDARRADATARQRTPQHRTPDERRGSRRSATTGSDADLGRIVRHLRDLAAFVTRRDAEIGELPERIGRLKVIDLLGSGGQATVLLAYDPDSQRHVVVKWYPAGSLARDATGWDEARVLCSVDHPHVVRCLGIEADERGEYLLLEPILGESLESRLRRPVATDQAIAWAIDIADAIGALHAVGWVHRDLSPRNIVVNRDGRAVLIDFGLARPIETSAPEAGLGAEYRAPEVDPSDPRRGDLRSDIYSLGRLLERLAARRHGSPDDSPSSSAKRLPLGVAAIVRRATAAQVEQRYDSAEALGGDLRRLVRRRSRRAWLARSGSRAALAAVGSFAPAVYVWSATGRDPFGIDRALSVDSPWTGFLGRLRKHPELLAEMPRLRHDFRLAVRLDGRSGDPTTWQPVRDGSDVDLELQSDLHCTALIYSLSLTKQGFGPLYGTPVAFARDQPLDVPAFRRTVVSLTARAEPDTYDFLYVVGIDRPLDPEVRRHVGSIPFVTLAGELVQMGRGLEARCRVAEALVPIRIES